MHVYGWCVLLLSRVERNDVSFTDSSYGTSQLSHPIFLGTRTDFKILKCFLVLVVLVVLVMLAVGVGR